MNDNLDFLHQELIRVTSWLKFAESKFILLSAYYGLGIAFITKNKVEIQSIFDLEMCVQLVDIFGMFIFIGFLASLLVGIYLLFKVIFPNISNESTNNSFFFFSHVASMKLENFIENFQALNEKQKTEQILEQIHTNSKITHQKMKNIKYSSKLLFLNLLFFFILIFII